MTGSVGRGGGKNVKFLNGESHVGGKASVKKKTVTGGGGEEAWGESQEKIGSYLRTRGIPSGLGPGANIVLKTNLDKRKWKGR